MVNTTSNQEFYAKKYKLEYQWKCIDIIASDLESQLCILTTFGDLTLIHLNGITFLDLIWQLQTNGYGMPSGRRNFVHAMLGNDTFLILGGYKGGQTADYNDLWV